MKKFWQFRNVTPQKGELTLYGEISDTSWWGDEVTPADFQRDLKALGDIEELNLYVNSPGGDVFAGFTIYNQPEAAQRPENRACGRTGRQRCQRDLHGGR